MGESNGARAEEEKGRCVTYAARPLLRRQVVGWLAGTTLSLQCCGASLEKNGRGRDRFAVVGGGCSRRKPLRSGEGTRGGIAKDAHAHKQRGGRHGGALERRSLVLFPHRRGAEASEKQELQGRA